MESIKGNIKNKQCEFNWETVRKNWNLERKYIVNTNIIGEKAGFLIRLAKVEDVTNYYEQNYCPLDKEVAHLTGCKEVFTKEEVTSFFLKSLEEDEWRALKG